MTVTTAEAVARWRQRRDEASAPPRSYWGEMMLQQPDLIVMPTIEAAELFATRLAAGVGGAEDRPTPPPVHALEDTTGLHAAVGALQPGAHVVLFDQAQAIAGDLVAQGLVVRTRCLPYPHGSAQAFVAHLDGLGLPREVVAGYLWDAIEDATSVDRHTARPTGHPLAPRIGQSSPIVAAWRPTPIGTLSTVPPPRSWLLRRHTRDGRSAPPNEGDGGDGVLSLGVVGLLSSAGGVGKSFLCAQAAVAIVTGRDWLGEFVVDRAVVGRRVLLAAAEEDVAELHRRLYAIACQLDLTEAERRLVEERVQLLGLAGTHCGLLTRSQTGALEETAAAANLRRLLNTNAGPTGWGLVVLDPLSRFAGSAAIDKDNTESTDLITTCETFTRAPGTPVVWLPHHTSKVSRREGKAESRGATGLEDAVRWAATLVQDKDGVQFVQSKSNYSRPWSEPVRLVRLSCGPLRAIAAAEVVAEDKIKDTQQRQAEADRIQRAVEILTDIGQTSRESLARRIGGKLTLARDAIDAAITSHQIDDIGTERRSKLVLGTSRNGAADCGRHTPHTPRDGTGRPAAEPQPPARSER